MAALACSSKPSWGVTCEQLHQHARINWGRDVFRHAILVLPHEVEGVVVNRQRLQTLHCQMPALGSNRTGISPVHRQTMGAVARASCRCRLSGVEYLRHSKGFRLRVRAAMPRVGTCRLGQAPAVEEAPPTHLDVAEFLRDSLPCSAVFGGYSFDTHLQGSCFERTMNCEDAPSSLLGSQPWRRAEWGSISRTAMNVVVSISSNLVQYCDDGLYGEAPASQAKLSTAAPTLPPLPAASIATLAAVVLLILGPSQPGVAMLPVLSPQQTGVWAPLIFKVRPSLDTPVQRPDIVYSSTTNKWLQSQPSSPSLSPRLPVLVYDPDELLREPPREEATKRLVDVKTPTDLAESLQKGCGGPQCIAVLFRPSAALEGMGFAGAVVLGVVSERRKSGLAQLQDLVRAAQDERQESEALVASLQQELQLQRSLLSDVLQQRIPLSHIQLDPRVIQARLPEKKPIGSREWMEGMGMRSLDAVGAKKGAGAAALGPAPEQPYFPKMGQVHGHDASKPRSLVPEEISRVVDRTSRALGLAGTPTAVLEPEQEEGGHAGLGGVAEAAAPAMRYVIPDTNQFLTNLSLVKRLRGTTGVQTVVPLAVLSELDGLQNNPNKRINSLARRALRYLTQEMKAGVTWLRGQRRSEVRCLVGVDPAKRLGKGGGVQSPREGWRQTTYSQDGPVVAADDALVDCCIHFLEGGSEVTLLTEDKTLQLKAMFHAISSVSIRDFLALPQPGADTRGGRDFLGRPRKEPRASRGPVVLPESIDTEVALDQLREYESTTNGKASKRAAAPSSRTHKELANRRSPATDQRASESDVGLSDKEPVHGDGGVGVSPGGVHITERVSRSSRDGSATASGSTPVELEPHVGGKKRPETGGAVGRSRGDEGGAEHRARESGDTARRRSESPGSSRSGPGRGGGGRGNAGKPLGENGKGERAKTGRGRATTSGRRGTENGRTRPGDSGESEGEGRSRRKSSARNKTQGRKPRFAQTTTGKSDEQARSVVRGLADMLDGYAREGVGKGPALESDKSRDSGKSTQGPH